MFFTFEPCCEQWKPRNVVVAEYVVRGATFDPTGIRGNYIASGTGAGAEAIPPTGHQSSPEEDEEEGGEFL